MSGTSSAAIIEGLYPFSETNWKCAKDRLYAFCRSLEGTAVMRRIGCVSAVALLLLQILWSSPAPAQSVNDVLAAVSRNVKEFQDLLPDFVCNERIASTKFDSGKVVKETVVESIFTGVQQFNVENRFRAAFTESREVLSVNGKPARKGAPFPKLPYRFTGGYSSLLITTFASDNLQHHNYTLVDKYKSGSSTALLLQFATKEGQQSLRLLFQGTRLFAKDIGAAWVDASSFQVLRLQRKSLNLPSGFTQSIATADYGPVTVDDRQFWMPIKIRAEITETNPRATVSYVAEYRDCRRFTTDIKILP
jgi:hypothetical protein